MTISSARIKKRLRNLEGSSYLEVGVQAGKTFHKVEADDKVAVHPKFLFYVDQSRENYLHCIHHEVTSNQYFS